MTETLIGYARCSTDKQDLTAQRQKLAELGVAPERIYMLGLHHNAASQAVDTVAATPENVAVALRIPGPLAERLTITGRFGGEVLPST